jgi:hypothetical protein
MEINISAKIRAEENEPTERKEDLKKACSQQKLHWANQKVKLSENMEATKRFGCYQ